MSNYAKYRLLAFLIVCLIGYVYAYSQNSKGNTKIIEHPFPSNIPTVTEIIRPMPNALPKVIQDAGTWPVISLCDDKSGYTLFYQLEDGSNIYKDQNGGFIRAKKVRCTN